MNNTPPVKARSFLTREEREKIGSGCKGDVYLGVDLAKDDPLAQFMVGKGEAFQIVQRNITFDEWDKHRDIAYWLGDVRNQVGYYDIEADTIQEGSMSAPGMFGILVPRRLNKKLVADDLRRRFGPGTILLQETVPV